MDKNFKGSNTSDPSGYFLFCDTGDEDDRNVEESLDLRNGVHLDNDGKFCYLGDMLNGVEEEILYLRQGRAVCGGSLRSYQGSLQGRKCHKVKCGP